MKFISTTITAVFKGKIVPRQPIDQEIDFIFILFFSHRFLFIRMCECV